MERGLDPLKTYGVSMTNLVIRGLNDDIEKNELNAKANGGTEMMQRKLASVIDKDLYDKFQIICSRVRDIDKDRIPILWCHDTFNDPESQHLKHEINRDRFKQIVFVSNYQFQTYHLGLGVPYGGSCILKNAIDPIETHEKEKTDTLNLIYHTTPHRGLEILVPVFEHLYDKHKGKIHLDVYSSFNAYGWPQRDKEYEPIFARCREHEGITYHGFQENEVVREALKKAHIFAYPNIWPETSCIAAMEAMSAGVCIIAPNHAALPETTANFALMYQMQEDQNVHANTFASILDQVITTYWNSHMQQRIQLSKIYADSFYSWDVRKFEWQNLLTSLSRM